MWGYPVSKGTQTDPRSKLTGTHIPAQISFLCEVAAPVLHRYGVSFLALLHELFNDKEIQIWMSAIKLTGRLSDCSDGTPVQPLPTKPSTLHK